MGVDRGPTGVPGRSSQGPSETGIDQVTGDRRPSNNNLR